MRLKYGNVKRRRAVFGAPDCYRSRKGTRNNMLKSYFDISDKNAPIYDERERLYATLAAFEAIDNRANSF